MTVPKNTSRPPESKTPITVVNGDPKTVYIRRRHKGIQRHQHTVMAAGTLARYPTSGKQGTDGFQFDYITVAFGADHQGEPIELYASRRAMRAFALTILEQLDATHTCDVHDRKYTEILYTITSEANDALNTVARTGRLITPEDIRNCVTETTKLYVRDYCNGDHATELLLIYDIMRYQFSDWLPDLGE